MNSEKAFYIVFATAILLAGTVGFFIGKGSNNIINNSTNEFKVDPAIADANDSTKNARADSLAAAISAGQHKN